MTTMTTTNLLRAAIALGAMTVAGTAVAQKAPAMPALPAMPAMYAMASAPALPALPALAAEPEGMGQDQPVHDDLFAGTEVFAKNATEVSEVNMNPHSLDMVQGSNAHRAHSMVLNTVRSYQYDKPGMYDMAEVDKFRAKLNTGDWYCSVHTRNMKSGESTDVCEKHRTDGMRETAIVTVEPKQLTFIHTIRKADGGGSEVSFPYAVPGMAPMVALGPQMAALSGSLARLEAPSLGKLNAELAMLANGDALAELHAVQMKERMEYFNSAEFKAKMDAMQQKFNSPEWKAKMEEMQKRFNSPEFKERMEKMQKDMATQPE